MGLMLSGNTAPVAVDDSVTGTEDAPTTAWVVMNDSDPDGDSIHVVDVTQASQGEVSFTCYAVTYTAPPDWNGTATFDYTITDGHGHRGPYGGGAAGGR